MGSPVALSADSTSIQSTSMFLSTWVNWSQLEVQYQLETKCQDILQHKKESQALLKKQLKYCLKGETGLLTRRQNH